MGGWALRWSLWQTEMVRERFRAERERLGVPEGGWEGLIRKMKREGKGRVVVSGGEGARNDGCVGGNEEVEEEPSKDKAFMEESPLMKSLEQPPAESR